MFDKIQHISFCELKFVGDGVVKCLWIQQSLKYHSSYHDYSNRSLHHQILEYKHKRCQISINYRHYPLKVPTKHPLRLRISNNKSISNAKHQLNSHNRGRISLAKLKLLLKDRDREEAKNGWMSMSSSSYPHYILIYHSVKKEWTIIINVYD